MIVELFGLPASGKTTLAKRWAEEGWTRVTITSRIEMVRYFFLFLFTHPFRAVRLLLYCVRFGGGGQRLYLKLSNLFFYNLALYQKAKNYQKALLDQGPHQFLLSLFESEQSQEVIARLLSVVPRSDLLLVVATPDDVRAERLRTRGKVPRSEFGEEAAHLFAHVSGIHFKHALRTFSSTEQPVLEVSDSVTPSEAVLNTWSYVTFARMPTEKAHGVSIAHMCHSFVSLGKRVTLLIPKRKNAIRESVYSYYGVPETFSVKEIPVPDFLGRGLSGAAWFFLQRVLFLVSLRSRTIPPGVVYTRDPEIAFAYARSHLVVFESHRIPRRALALLSVLLIRRSVLVVCNSEGTERAWRRLGITHTVVATNGFSPDIFSTPLRLREDVSIPSGFVALYAGSDQSWKGADVFRNAAPYAPSVEFVFLGSTSVGEHNNLHERGTVPSRDVGQYIRNADVLVVPNTTESRESTEYTSPIKVFEYMAAGKPIVASDLPSLRAILDDSNALFVHPGDAQDLAEKIEYLQKNPEIAARLGARAQNDSLQYTWTARAQKIIDAL